MEETLLSIIIPAHNAASTLERLIKSIQVKNEKIEIIIVENGSQDATLEVAHNLAEQYPYIRVMQSEKGVSAARNEGLKHAQGKWIAFADADDWFIPGTLSELIKHADADLTLFCYEAGKKKRIIASGHECFKGKECQSARVRMLENPTLYMPVWSKLFSGDIIRRYGLQFDKRLAFSEDSDFTFRYSKYCSSIAFSDKYMYHYDINDTSVMHTFDGKKTEQYLKAMQITSGSLDQEPQIIKDAFKKYILMHLNIVMVREVYVAANKESFSKKTADMKRILKKEPFASTLRSIKLSDCKSVRTLPIAMLKLKCYRIAGMIFQLKAAVNARREKAEAYK